MINGGNNLPDLPTGWLWTKLGEISSLGAGNPAPQGKQYFDNGIYPFVRVQDMGSLGNHVYIYDTRDHLNSNGMEKMRIFPQGSVLFTKSGMSILLNQRAILGRDMSVVSHVGLSIPLGGVPSEWLYYWLKTIDFRNLTHATTLPSLQLSKVQEIPTPLPPLPEQHRIVAKIEELFTRVDAGVKALKKVKAQLRGYRQAVLKHAFEGKLTEEWREGHKGEIEPASVLLRRIKQEQKQNVKGKYNELPPLDTSSLPELPDGWAYLTLGHLVTSDKNSIKRGPFGSSIKKAFFVPYGYKVYEQGNVIYNDFERGGYFIDDNKFHELKDFEVKAGDVLMSCSGTVGKIAIVPEGMQPGVINQALLKITLDNEVIDTLYFTYLLRSRIDDIILKNTRGSAMVNISSARDLRQIPLPIPSLAEQHKIVEEIERCSSVADDIEKVMEQSLMQAERLRQSILRRAFEGKLVPQDPTDEPAEKLLERIRVERTKREVEAKTPNKVKGKVLKPGRLLP